MTKETIIKEFPWGTINQCYEIGEYLIIEYINKSNETYYHPYINGKDTNMGYETLDQSIVGCITRKYDGVNNQHADRFIFKMLDM